MTRRARPDAALRDGRVEVCSTALRGPARGVELLRRIARVELRIAARTKPRALVTLDAERRLAMTRAAVRAAAPRVDRVDEQVVRGVELERLHRALVALDALGAVVTRVARRIEAAR